MPLREADLSHPGTPSRETVLAWLDEGYALNPGPWRDHSLHVAEAARLIADKAGLDSHRAWAMGALHDIGRREGKTALRHVIDGYRFLWDNGSPDTARICLTHSFPRPELESFFGTRDCTPDDKAFLKDYLHSTPYDDYDRLIQLCDCLGDARGFVLVEKRLIDVICRYGTNEYTRDKIQAQMDNLAYFNRLAGVSLYTLLPGVAGNTFGGPVS